MFHGGLRFPGGENNLRLVFFGSGPAAVMASGHRGGQQAHACSQAPNRATRSDPALRLTERQHQRQYPWRILEKLGFTVEYPQETIFRAYHEPSRRHLTIGVEYWTRGEAMRLRRHGQTYEARFARTEGQEECWYPIYMKEKLSGPFRTGSAQDPKCAEAFLDPRHRCPKGRYLGGPVTWEVLRRRAGRALGAAVRVVHAGTDGAMFAELESAYQRKAPIMLWVYSPHWAPSKYEGEWIEFPEYTPECYTDAKWGSNPDKAHDCGKPHGEIWKYSWAGMKDKWPVAYKVAKAYQIDSSELNQLSGQVDLEGKTIEEVAAAWVDANESKWRAWAQ